MSQLQIEQGKKHTNLIQISQSQNKHITCFHTIHHISSQTSHILFLVYFAYINLRLALPLLLAIISIYYFSPQLLFYLFITLLFANIHMAFLGRYYFLTRGFIAKGFPGVGF